ncbi:Fucose permease [Mariniphaga anaerophila]|uniref:Fucose permease n=1 Tax=Mariniphaga anaerophila TaxID=1484053 RepID=A0A1M4WLL5_9BACT|nr:sugar MFS transporter [Mariniphaga anaerophila]SHE82050.1 Fucose permease [Mariniphaga anaerophila]
MNSRNGLVVVLILFIWFVISFVTNILGPLMPVIIDNYNLSLTLGAFLPFSFFLAYGVMSIPAGFLVERYGEKTSMLISFGLNLAGSFLFALFPGYTVALFSLFIIGIGMAMLQVIINPLMRVAGGEENFAFFSVMGQLVFGGASFISPFVFTYLMRNLSNYGGDGNALVDMLSRVIPEGLPWVSLYWIFTAVFVVVLLIIALVKLPKVELKDDEKVEALQSYLSLFRQRKVLLYFAGIMAYVGTEQGVANWMSKFLHSYHGISPEGAGAHAISWFWGLMSIGCLVGLVLLKLMDSRRVLKIFSVLSVISLLLALFGSSSVSLIAFPAIGFFISVMFSIIFSLALNSVKAHHGAFSGILCSGIFGGALVPLIIGWIGDFVGLRLAMLFLLLTMGYIFSIAFWARPLVNNKTTTVKEIFASLQTRSLRRKDV